MANLPIATFEITKHFWPNGRLDVRRIYDSVVASLSEKRDRKFIAVETSFFSRWYNNQSRRIKILVDKLVKQGKQCIVLHCNTLHLFIVPSSMLLNEWTLSTRQQMRWSSKTKLSGPSVKVRGQRFGRWKGDAEEEGEEEEDVRSKWRKANWSKHKLKVAKTSYSQFNSPC